MKKVYLLLTAVILFSACEKEEISPDITNKEISDVESAFVEEVYFSELSEEQLSQLKFLSTARSTKNSSTFFGNVNQKVPARKLIDDYGGVS